MLVEGQMPNDMERVDERIDVLENVLRRIAEWADAYPLEAFPQPELARAREVLEAAGMSLDAISTGAMRHVLEGVGRIAREALQ